MRIQVKPHKQKYIAVGSKLHGIRMKKMQYGDVKKYFYSLKKKPRNDVDMSNSCERCGILVGEGFIYDKFQTIILLDEDGWGMPIDVCERCYDYKKNGYKECSPDVEDIIRYNVTF